jgi:hypothetical protein
MHVVHDTSYDTPIMSSLRDRTRSVPRLDSTTRVPRETAVKGPTGPYLFSSTRSFLFTAFSLSALPLSRHGRRAPESSAMPVGCSILRHA